MPAWLRRAGAVVAVTAALGVLFLLANGLAGDASQEGLPDGVVTALSEVCQLPNAHVAGIGPDGPAHWVGRCAYAPFDWPGYAVAVSCVDGRWHGSTGYPGSFHELSGACAT